MTSFFDDASRNVRDAAGAVTRDEDFIIALHRIEEEVSRTVSLVTGDREFPDDLRENIQEIIAVYSVDPGMPGSLKHIQYATATRSSRMIEELHSAFHRLARRRHKTRFGILGDNPQQILVLRDDHDSEPASGTRS